MAEQEDFCSDDVRYRCEHLDINPLSQKSFKLRNGKLPAHVAAAYERGELYTVCEECAVTLGMGIGQPPKPAQKTFPIMTEGAAVDAKGLGRFRKKIHLHPNTVSDFPAWGCEHITWDEAEEVRKFRICDECFFRTVHTDAELVIKVVLHTEDGIMCCSHKGVVPDSEE